MRGAGMSDTPRTLEAFNASLYQSAEAQIVSMTGHARTLERELSEKERQLSIDSDALALLRDELAERAAQVAALWEALEEVTDELESFGPDDNEDGPVNRARAVLDATKGPTE